MAKDTTSLNTWKEMIRNGQRFQQRIALSNDWGRYKNYYRGSNARKNILMVNLMFSVVRSMVPQVYPRNPRVTATARKPGFLADINARVVQRADNWLIKELGIKREFKSMITDTFFCGIGGGFFGYDSEFGFSDNLADSSGQASLTQFDDNGDRIEFRSGVNPGMPWFLRARPEDVVFPWGTVSTSSSPWVALRVFRQTEDVKADKKYSNTSTLAGQYSLRRSLPEGGSLIDVNQAAGIADSTSWVELWEVHDLRTGKVKVLTMDHDKYLRDDEDTMQIDGLPVETICFNPDPDYIYGVPDARVIEPQLLELNDIRTQAMKHRRSDVAKLLCKKGVISDADKKKLLSEDVQALVDVDSDAPDLRSVLLPFSPGVSGILQDLIAQGEIARGDVREAVGFSRTAAGEFQGKTHVSAEETNRVFQSMNIRLDERRDEIAELLERVVRKWNQVIFTRWTSERLAQIVGPDGATYWIRFTGPQIKEEYDIDIVAEEGPPMDRETKTRLAMEAAKTWAELQAAAAQTGQPVPPEISRMLFSRFEDTGLDIDKLLAQSNASFQAMAQARAQGAGQSPSQALSPTDFAKLQGAQK